MLEPSPSDQGDEQGAEVISQGYSEQKTESRVHQQYEKNATGGGGH